MRCQLKFLLSALVWISCAACAPSATPTVASPSGSPSAIIPLQPGEAPTATTVWFPPTPTYTPLPNVTLGARATPDPADLSGERILEDNFDQPEFWTTGKTSAGSIAFGISELSLGVAQPEGYLQSLRNEPTLTDFSLEITASPSICRDRDEYGIVFHVTPTLDLFRFGLNCDGEARLERVLSGSATPSQEPQAYGVIPPGAPSSTRIGIRSTGKEMRFFANGEFLFTVEDPSIPAGGLGVFTRSAGPAAMTVNFSDLDIYEARP